MSHRVVQVQAELQRRIAEVIQRKVSDPRIEGMISITQVDVTPDLREATAYVSILPSDLESKTIHGLKAAERHIQKLVGKLVSFNMPHLRFRLDSSLKKSADIFQAIDEASQRTAETSDSENPTDK